MSWFQISHQFVCLGKTQACVNWTVTHLQLHTKAFDLKYLVQKEGTVYASVHQNFFFIPSSEEVEMVLMLLDMENQAL